MPYSKDNPPQWASKKSAKVQEVAIRVFNENIKAGKSESEARIASLAAMKNAEEAKAKKSGVTKAIMKMFNIQEDI